MKRVVLAVLMVFVMGGIAYGQTTYKKGDAVEIQTQNGQWQEGKVVKIVTSKDSDGKSWTTYLVEVTWTVQIADTDAANVMRAKSQSSSPTPAAKKP